MESSQLAKSTRAPPAFIKEVLIMLLLCTQPRARDKALRHRGDSASPPSERTEQTGHLTTMRDGKRPSGQRQRRRCPGAGRAVDVLHLQ